MVQQLDTFRSRFLNSSLDRFNVFQAPNHSILKAQKSISIALYNSLRHCLILSIVLREHADPLVW